MNSARKVPFACTGILGVALTQMPRSANALSLFGHTFTDDFVMGVVPPFIGGCGAALLAAGVAARVVSRRKARLAQEEAQAVANEEPRPVAASVHKPRHIRASEWETSNTIRVQDVESALAGPNKGSVGEKPHEARCDSNDYGDVAEHYVSKKTFAERMTNRARGVAALLSERLTSDMMAGVPIIARADGSVGDVGTIWWDKAMEEDNVSKGFDLWILGTEDTMANRPKTDEMEQGKTVAASAELIAEASSVAASKDVRPLRNLSALIPQIDEGIFPEDKEVMPVGMDSFEMAMEALGDEFAVAPMVVFQDVVGGEDTLDEPDDLEGPTEFLKFRIPGGHPEVVDTGSYIDYLLSEELANNSSSAVRRRAPQQRTGQIGAHARRRASQATQSTLATHQYLKLVEGGAKPSGKHFARSQEPQGEYQPKHMARPLAMEA